MSMLLDRRNDGSLAFFLDGDLQFDSQDERIYHEGLALPAIALAESRSDAALKVLIIGGGDGLTAREVLKSKRVSRVDLVDYDDKVLELASTEFTPFNNNSLADPRMHVAVEDARQFIARALDAGTTYDVIISDLTAAHDVEAAQLQSIEFYESLSRLLAGGILAVNSASPSGTPEAYMSIFNSLLASSLNPRAYRVFIPSFAKQGYGADWGFILASTQLITAEEVSALRLTSELHELKDAEHLRQLFFLPQESMAKQNTACAGSNGSDILVHYLFNAKAIQASGTMVDALSLDLSKLTAPKQSGLHILPREIQETLSKWQANPQQQEVISEVFEMMPAQHRGQTREMIAAFLDSPASFLAPIDLGALVNALLKRAYELPAKLVQELILLKDKIVEYGQDHERLFSLGYRSLAIIALVVIMGNLMYPDSVYAKGHADAPAAARHGNARHGNARRGGTGVWNNNGGVYDSTTGHWGPWYTNANGKRVRNWIP